MESAGGRNYRRTDRADERGPKWIDRETRAACPLYESRVSRRKMVTPDCQVQGVPKELGVLLVVSGIGGLLLPGPVGTPFLILGGVILWPAGIPAGGKLLREAVSARFINEGMMQIARFVRDLERRYPWAR